MAVIEQPIEDFFRTHRIAVVTTTRRDGSPQSTPISYLYEDGRLIFSTCRNRAKTKNLKRDDRIALCIVDSQPPFRYRTVYGRAQVIEDDVIEAHRRLFGAFRPDALDNLEEVLQREGRVVVYVTPERVLP